jgi:hypothetical protein
MVDVCATWFWRADLASAAFNLGHLVELRSGVGNRETDRGLPQSVGERPVDQKLASWLFEIGGTRGGRI